MTINQRLKDFFESKNISAPIFYKKIGVSRTIWSSWINDFKPITVKQIQSILSAYNELNARWLLTGEGKMLIENEAVKVVYPNEESVNPLNEKITLYTCDDCIKKQKEIDSLTRANDDLRANLEDLRSHIRLLEFNLGKNLKASSE